MSSFTLGTFNVKNLIGADQEYYKWERYTAEEHAWKQDWLSDQLLAMDADIVGFQEIFEEDALAAVAGVRGVHVTDDTARLSVDAIHRVLPGVLEALTARGIALEELRTHHATLEDVFVDLGAGAAVSTLSGNLVVHLEPVARPSVPVGLRMVSCMTLSPSSGATRRPAR